MKWQPTPVFLPGESQGRRSLVGCCLWGDTELDTEVTWHACMHSRGKWQPTQCSCLENPRNGGAWWAAVCGIAQSWTWLKWPSSSSRHNLTLLSLLRKFNKASNSLLMKGFMPRKRRNEERVISKKELDKVKKVEVNEKLDNAPKSIIEYTWLVQESASDFLCSWL